MRLNKEATVIWTGIIEVVGNTDCELLDPNSGAFVRVFAWVDSTANFEERAKELMTHYKLHVLSFVQVEKIKDGMLYGETESRLQELLGQTRKTKGVIFGTFDSYPLHNGKKM